MDKIIYNIIGPDNATIVGVFFKMYSASYTKYKFLQLVFDNKFVSSNMKDQILDVFSRIQKTYFAFIRFKKIMQHRKYPLYNTTDLVMNPITRHSKQVIELYQNKKIYLFTRQDIINTMNAALSHSQYFFSKPLITKNPYNNMVFTKSDLYNFYFFVKNSDYIMSQLIQQYFLANFDLNYFRDNNENIIREYYIKNYINTTPAITLAAMVKYMFMRHNIKRIRIHREFPHNKLVQIMKPYLMLYYKSNYSLDIQLRNIAYNTLHHKLLRFARYNSQFGRKYITQSLSADLLNRKQSISFNEDYIAFNSPESQNISGFMNSHNMDDDVIETDDDDMDISDTESDSDDTVEENILVVVPVADALLE